MQKTDNVFEGKCESACMTPRRKNFNMLAPGEDEGARESCGRLDEARLQQHYMKQLGKVGQQPKTHRHSRRRLGRGIRSRMQNVTHLGKHVRKTKGN